MTVATVLAQLPPNVAEVLRDPIAEVLSARTGPLLWIGAIIGLWTVGSFIETIRDILRRAYGVKYCAPFWHYRLSSMAVIVGAVFLLLFAFAASVALSSVEHAVVAWIPVAQEVSDAFTLYRVIPAIALYATISFIFYLLTPLRYRRRGCRKWPGALLIAAWWLGTAELLPEAISLLGGYDLTSGSLAGVGAELNAALAEASPTALKGEIYSGPYKDQLEVEEPQPGEDVELVPQKEGPQL